MRISKIVCDGCGKEIHGKPIRIFAERVDRETGDIVEESSVYAPNKDFCDNCFGSIRNFVAKIVVGLAEEEPALEEQQPPMVEPEKELVEPEPEEPKPEEPKLPQEEKTGQQPAPKKEGKKPSIRDLVLQGLSQEEVCRKTGCTPLTYTQTKYQLRKKGLLPEEPIKKTVNCNGVHDTCKYAGKGKQCNYLIITDKMRGCPVEACDKYEKK